MGSWGNRSSTSKAALYAIRRAPQLGLADHVKTLGVMTCRMHKCRVRMDAQERPTECD
ncbi:MAG: hypothetical protein ACJAXM_001058 [Arenicella sp.]|jgi:hypothetical protein